MRPILKETLKQIKIESKEDHFNKSFGLVDKLLNEYGEKNLASRLYKEIDSSIDWTVIADLFGILVWSTSDNGHLLSKETEKWLIEADNPRKIKIALNLDVYPFLERQKMEEVLTEVIATHPDLAMMCNDIIESRRKGNA